MNRIFYIALNTFRESVRSKVLYSILFFAGILVLISSFFGAVTIGDQMIVIKDFGLMSISVFSVIFAVISGSTLLNKELSRKTIYNILAKPVARWEFLTGKYMGMLSTASLLVILMGLGLSLFTWALEGRFDFLLFYAYLNIIFELIIVCAAAIFFSSLVVTPMLNGVFTFGIFLAGRSTEQVLYFIKQGSLSGIMAKALQCLYYLLPHLDKLNVSNSIVYADMTGVGISHVLYSLIYCFGYSIALLFLAHLIFLRREFN